jgi:hypothetical protein
MCNERSGSVSPSAAAIKPSAVVDFPLNSDIHFYWGKLALFCAIYYFIATWPDAKNRVTRYVMQKTRVFISSVKPEFAAERQILLTSAKGRIERVGPDKGGRWRGIK